jgi:hypothetical protein
MRVGGTECCSKLIREFKSSSKFSQAPPRTSLILHVLSGLISAHLLLRPIGAKGVSGRAVLS